jgi:hypothetical protein
LLGVHPTHPAPPFLDLVPSASPLHINQDKRLGNY